MAQKKRGPKPSAPVVSTEARLLGKRVTQLREESGLKQEDLAEKIGITQAGLSKIERGRVNPNNSKSQGNIQKIADFFGDSLGQHWLKPPARVKIVAYVAGGLPIVEDIEDTFIKIDSDFIALRGEECGLKVRGDSMVSEHILSGDILICRRMPPRDVVKGTIVVIDLKGERGATVKRWEVADEKLYLYAEKDATPAQKAERRTWEVGKVYKILAVFRQM